MKKTVVQKLKDDVFKLLDGVTLKSQMDNILLNTFFDKAEKEEKEQQTPIELPSDKEIYELMDNLPFSKHIGDELFNNGQRKGFELGIKYIRHQILNQNK